MIHLLTALTVRFSYVQTLTFPPETSQILLTEVAQNMNYIGTIRFVLKNTITESLRKDAMTITFYVAKSCKIEQTDRSLTN